MESAYSQEWLYIHMAYRPDPIHIMIVFKTSSWVQLLKLNPAGRFLYFIFIYFIIDTGSHFFGGLFEVLKTVIYFKFAVSLEL